MKTVRASILLLALFAAVATAWAADKTDEKQARTIVDEISKDVARLRGLEFKKPVAVAVLAPAEMEKHISDEIERQCPKEQFAANERAFKVLGLLSEDYDFRAGILALYREQMLGLYDPQGKRMILAQDKALKALARMGLAHELTHALQDQHFDLGKMIAGDLTEDRGGAVSMLIEGDATVMTLLYVAEGTVDRGDLLRETVEAGGTKGLDDAPPFLRNMLMAPYLHGMAFVNHFRDGDWKNIDAIYADPPLTTEQLMHPRKYSPRRDFPQRIDLPELPAKPAGTKRCDTSLGELGTLSLVESWGAILDDADLSESASAAAAGWDGDRLVRVDSADGGFTVWWISTWDTPGDATEMQEAAGKWTTHWAAAEDAGGVRAAKVFRPETDGKPGSDVIAVFARAPKGAAAPEPAVPAYRKTVVRTAAELPTAN